MNEHKIGITSDSFRHGVAETAKRLYGQGVSPDEVMQALQQPQDEGLLQAGLAAVAVAQHPIHMWHNYATGEDEYRHTPPETHEIARAYIWQDDATQRHYDDCVASGMAILDALAMVWQETLRQQRMVPHVGTYLDAQQLEDAMRPYITKTHNENKG